MLGKIEKQEHYGREVFVNTLTEQMRRSECLCLNCVLMNDGCDFAAAAYGLCKDWNVAFCVTRCPGFEAEEVFTSMAQVEERFFSQASNEYKEFLTTDELAEKLVARSTQAIRKCLDEAIRE